MKVAYFGSGAFGIPTLDALRADPAVDVRLVVCQPARPAGRKRALTATPIEDYARDHGIPVFTPEDPNAPEAIARVASADADVFVVIAYGHKLGPALLGETFAINLHGSLLPKYRGAAPINRAMMAGETHTGVSVIALAQTMDAGVVYATRQTSIRPDETAGELHDRLADLGPAAIGDVLEAWRTDRLEPIAQAHDESTRAPKLSKSDGTVRFDQPADRVRAIVHGLTPWPGCTVQVNGERLKLLRVAAEGDEPHDEAGTIDDAGRIRCAAGRLHPIAVQPAGGKSMSFEAFCRGRRLGPGARLEPVPPS